MKRELEDAIRVLAESHGTQQVRSLKVLLDARIEEARQALEDETETIEIFRLQGQISGFKSLLDEISPEENIQQPNGGYLD